MRIAKRSWSTGAIALGCIAVGLAISLGAKALRNEVLGLLGALAYWAGWIVLFVWLFRGYRRRVTLRHTVRVGVWMAGAVFFTMAVLQLENQLSGLKDVSIGLMYLFFVIGCGFAGLGWYEWDWGVSHHTGRDEYDDWDSGDGSNGGGSSDGDFDMDG